MASKVLLFNGQRFYAKLVCGFFTDDSFTTYFDIYVDEVKHMALLVSRYDVVISTAHLESWQQDILIEDDKTEEEEEKADEIIDSLRKEWEIDC